MKSTILFKYLALLLLQCLITAAVFAQTRPPKQWDARFGGDANDFHPSLQGAIQQTSDGGYIIGGISESGISGDKTQINQGLRDYWIVKTDANGLKQWDATFGGSGNDVLTSLQQTTDGGYILGGFSTSGISGDRTEPSWGGEDFWVVKTDANGVKQWDKRYGGSGHDELTTLQQTSDGGYIFGGGSSSPISGDKTQDNHFGGSDMWVVKTDANGLKQWDARYGNLFNADGLYSLQQTTDGGYILAGLDAGGVGGEQTNAPRGSLDYWIVKIDANGVKQWDARFGGSDQDNFVVVRQTIDEGYIIAGGSSSGISGDKTQVNQGSGDIWMVKTDAYGVKQWDAAFGGNDNDDCRSVWQTSDGGYVLGGTSQSGISGDKTQASRGSFDFWIIKTDGNGIKQWDATYGGTDQDHGYEILQTSDGGFVFGGISKSCIRHEKTQNPRGGYDLWIVKLYPEGTLGTFYRDNDNDGYGNAAVTVQAVDPPPGYVVNNLDCNDNNPSISPSCSSSGQSTFYADVDNDGYGDPAVSVPACTQPSGYVSDNTDCNDANAGIHPNATEVCNNIDDDCDGTIDEGQPNLTVSPLTDEYTYFGYASDQCVSKTAAVSGGTAPYAYSWTLNRPLLSDVITTSGDETMTGSNTATVTVCLLEPAILTITVTDANGCKGSSSATIYAEDVRCFAGNSTIQKVTICHGGKTICVDDDAVSDHLAHGDTRGKCPVSSIQAREDVAIERAGPALVLAPNPSRGQIAVQYNSKGAEKVQLKVYDLSGATVFQRADQSIKGTNTYQLNLSHLPAGSYYFELSNSSGHQQTRFVIQK